MQNGGNRYLPTRFVIDSGIGTYGRFFMVHGHRTTTRTTTLNHLSLDRFIFGGARLLMPFSGPDICPFLPLLLLTTVPSTIVLREKSLFFPSYDSYHRLSTVGGPGDPLPPVFFFQKNLAGKSIQKTSKILVVIWSDRTSKISHRRFLILPPPQRQSNSSPIRRPLREDI